MTRNKKNILKFLICAAATFGALYLTTINDWGVWHIIAFIACIAIFVWYTYHVFTDEQ